MLQNSQQILQNVQPIADQRNQNNCLCALHSPSRIKVVGKKKKLRLHFKARSAESKLRMSCSQPSGQRLHRKLCSGFSGFWKPCAQPRSREKPRGSLRPSILLQRKLKQKLSRQSQTQEWKCPGKRGKLLNLRNELIKIGGVSL